MSYYTLCNGRRVVVHPKAPEYVLNDDEVSRLKQALSGDKIVMIFSDRWVVKTTSGAVVGIGQNSKGLMMWVDNVLSEDGFRRVPE